MVRLKLTDREWFAEIADEVLQAIEKVAEESYPNEGGGFLFGRYEGQTVYVTYMEKPIKYRATRYSFERDVDKDQFERIQKEYQVHYVGEWHSHTNGKSQYSSRDIRSMAEIAEHETTGIVTPLLLIAAASKNGAKGYTLYLYDNKKLLRYGHC